MKYGDKCMVKDLGHSTWQDTIFILEANGRYLATSCGASIKDFQGDSELCEWWNKCVEPIVDKVIPFDRKTFLPHKSKWLVDVNVLRRVDAVSYAGVTCGQGFYSWSTLLNHFTFEDGSKCGVKI